MAITAMSLNPSCKYEKHYFNNRYFTRNALRSVITDFNKLLWVRIACTLIYVLHSKVGYYGIIRNESDQLFPRLFLLYFLGKTE